jgi:hypothetical protein
LPLHERHERVAKVIHAKLITALNLPSAPWVCTDTLQTAQDLLAMARGMIDAAGARRETDARNLHARVMRALLGYLSA